MGNGNATRETLRKLVAVALLLVVLATAITATAQGAPRPTDVQSTHIVLLTQDGDPTLVARRHGVGIAQTYRAAFNGFAAVVPEGRLAALQRDPDVFAVEPNLVLGIAEPLGGVEIQSAGLGTQAQSLPAGVGRVGADASPTANIDGNDDRVPAVVAVMDTGVEGSHPDLNVNITRSVDCSIGVCVTGLATDDNGHGTHVAGTIGAIDDDQGVVGVAPGAEIWSVRVCDAGGSCMLSAILAGHEYVSRHAAEIDVVNLSLGGLGWITSWRSAIADNVANGVVVVVAAGNSGLDIYGGDGRIGDSNEFVPAAFPEAMAISAMGDSDGVAGGHGPDTSYGPDDTMATFSNHSIAVVTDNPVASPGAAIDLATPGVSVLSTYTQGRYAIMSGTSMAAPHASGLVALRIVEDGRPADAAGVAALRQVLIDDASAMAGWREDAADTTSDRDTNHEGLGQASTSPAPAQDDAIVDSLSVPGTVVAGATVQVVATVRNAGPTVQTVNVSVVDETTETNVGSAALFMAAGETASLSFDWTPSAPPYGSRTIRASVTAAVNNETSNDSISRTAVVEAPLTDIAVTQVDAPLGAIAGSTVMVPVALFNAGNQDVAGPIVVGLASDAGTPGDPADDYVVGTESLASLDADTPAQVTFSWTVAGAIATQALTATLHAADDDPSNDALVALVAVTEAPGPLELSVTSSISSKGNGTWITFVVDVTDGSNGVAGATVDALLTAPSGRTRAFSGTTGGDGSFVVTHRVNSKRDGCGTFLLDAQASAPGNGTGTGSGLAVAC